MHGNYLYQLILKALNFVWATSLLMACNSGQSGLHLGEENISHDEARITAEMIEAIKDVSVQRYTPGEFKRFNQSKSLGCFDASFAVVKNLEESLQQGVFVAGKHYPAKIRFANATQLDDTEKDFRGMSIKLFNVQGDSLWGEQGQQDFILNSHPALFAANPDDFLAFIQATRDDQVWRYFINPLHLYSLKIIMSGRQTIENPFAIRYWSTTPYRHGVSDKQAVKYSVRSCSDPKIKTHADKGQNFLSENMGEHLRQGAACFDFLLQFQHDPESMPIEDASVIWDETLSPFIKVARINIHQQPFTSIKNTRACEQMTFNPWQSVFAHQPLGGINRTRKPVYSEMAKFRQQNNGSQ